MTNPKKVEKDDARSFLANAKAKEGDVGPREAGFGPRRAEK